MDAERDHADRGDGDETELHDDGDVTESHERSEETEERSESLWWLVVSPTIWLAHFLASYITAAIWCAKLGTEHGAITPVRWAIAAYTAVAMGGIVAVAIRGLRRHRFGTATVPHEFDTQADRHRFLGFAVLLLSGLSFVAVLHVAMPALFYWSCR